ncbi:unnamed protein product [Moneuplotes crassus]|uniref:Uncharacterized protein n=1 Tax=Euplotes crassus TaxID=5936 RepID=A0AAD1UCX6_EUPCR|nr:unnamed protein product [Moneuplotes crassus]
MFSSYFCSVKDNILLIEFFALYRCCIWRVYWQYLLKVRTWVKYFSSVTFCSEEGTCELFIINCRFCFKDMLSKSLILISNIISLIIKLHLLVSNGVDFLSKLC